jgi:hypothetical protein
MKGRGKKRRALRASSSPYPNNRKPVIPIAIGSEPPFAVRNLMKENGKTLKNTNPRLGYLKNSLKKNLNTAPFSSPTLSPPTAFYF